MEHDTLIKKLIAILLLIGVFSYSFAASFGEYPFSTNNMWLHITFDGASGVNTGGGINDATLFNWGMNNNTNKNLNSGGTSTYSRVYGKFLEGAYFQPTYCYYAFTNTPAIGTNAWTFMTWIQVRGKASTAAQVRILSLGPGESSHGILIYLDGGGNLYCLNQYGYFINNAATYNICASNYAGSNWCHICWVSDGALVNTTTNIHLYVNGSAWPLTISGTPAINIPANSGSLRDYGLWGNYNTFPYYMDEFILLNTNLSPAQVKRYYTYSKGRFGVL